MSIQKRDEMLANRLRGACPEARFRELIPLIRKHRGDEKKISEELQGWWDAPPPVAVAEWEVKTTKKLPKKLEQTTMNMPRQFQHPPSGGVPRARPQNNNMVARGPGGRGGPAAARGPSGGRGNGPDMRRTMNNNATNAVAQAAMQVRTCDERLDKRHKTRDTRQETRDTRHETRDTRQET